VIEATAISVETELQRYFAASRLRATDYGEHYVALWDALAEASTGGKRLRPALVLAAYSGFGGRDQEAAGCVAFSFELLHTAFIIHDDVIDHDLTRRGIPNIAGMFHDRALQRGASAVQASTWATAGAILAGDLALSAAHRSLALLRVDGDVRVRLLDLLDRSIFVSAAGELADVTNTVAGMPLPMHAVLSTLEQKTAIYSFEGPLRAGALLAGADQEALDVLGQFGRLVGVAFQIRDDCLGVFGDPAQTGKSTLADLREGKQTALLAHAQTTDAWQKIAPFIGKADLDETEAELVRAHLRACGAAESAETLAWTYAEHAADVLRSPTIPEVLRRSLVDLAQTAVQRCS
jgi:geranylgeranyl diphosphate synthase type II